MFTWTRILTGLCFGISRGKLIGTKLDVTNKMILLRINRKTCKSFQSVPLCYPSVLCSVLSCNMCWLKFNIKDSARWQESNWLPHIDYTSHTYIDSAALGHYRIYHTILKGSLVVSMVVVIFSMTSYDLFTFIFRVAWLASWGNRMVNDCPNVIEVILL